MIIFDEWGDLGFTAAMEDSRFVYKITPLLNGYVSIDGNELVDPVTGEFRAGTGQYLPDGLLAEIMRRWGQPGTAALAAGKLARS